MKTILKAEAWVGHLGHGCLAMTMPFSMPDGHVHHHYNCGQKSTPVDMYANVTHDDMYFNTLCLLTLTLSCFGCGHEHHVAAPADMYTMLLPLLTCTPCCYACWQIHYYATPAEVQKHNAYWPINRSCSESCTHNVTSKWSLSQTKFVV